MYLNCVQNGGEIMKLAIIGSRKIISFELDRYIPDKVEEIVSGGAIGVDSIAKEFAKKNGIRLTEFLPQYELYGKAAPIKRNEQIALYADEGLAIWDGKSNGTAHTIRFFQKAGKKVTVIIQQ